MLQRHPYRYEQPLPPSQPPPPSQHPSQTSHHPPPMTPGQSLVSTPLASTSSLSPPPKSAVSRKRKKTEDDAPRDRAQAEPRRLRRLHEACARCRGKKIKVSVPVRVRKHMLMLSSATRNTQTAARASRPASSASRKTAIARPSSPAATSSTSSLNSPSAVRYSLVSFLASTSTILTAISRTQMYAGRLRTQMSHRRHIPSSSRPHQRLHPPHAPTNARHLRRLHPGSKTSRALTRTTLTLVPPAVSVSLLASLELLRRTFHQNRRPMLATTLPSKATLPEARPTPRPHLSSILFTGSTRLFRAAPSPARRPSLPSRSGSRTTRTVRSKSWTFTSLISSMPVPSLSAVSLSQACAPYTALLAVDLLYRTRKLSRARTRP